MTSVRRATLLTFDTTSWLAQVLLDGADSECQMPAGEWVPAGQLTAGAEVACICFDDTNTDDGVVLGAYGGVWAWALPSLNIGSAAGAATGQVLIQGSNGVPLQTTVDGTGNTMQLVAYNAGVATGSAGLSFLAARGSKASPAASQAGDWIGTIAADGYHTAGTPGFGGHSPFIRIIADENWTDVAQGVRVELYTIADGSAIASKTLTLGPGAKLGVLGAAAASQQTSGANLTNNVTSGGTNDQIDNWTSLTTYSTDAAAIRNAVYQLARKLKQVNDALRLFGFLT